MQKDYGMWADLRRDYLKQEKPEIWKQLLEEADIEKYLQEYQEEMAAKAERLTKELEKKMKVTEELKKTNVMAWIRRKNQIQQTVLEVMQQEIQT